MILSSKVDPPDHDQVEDGAPTCSLPSPGTRLPHSYSWYCEGHCNRGNSSAFSMTICYLMLSSSQTRYFGISLHLCVYQVARRGVRVSDQLVAALLKSVFQVNPNPKLDKPARLRFYLYLSNSTKMATNTETAMLSRDLR